MRCLLPCESCQLPPALPICVSWLPRGGFCAPAGPVPVQSPTRISLTFAGSCSDCGSFLHSAAVTGQVTLEQNPKGVTVQEGDEFTFECSLKGGDMNDYYMYWYRQDRWGSLEWIYIDGADSYGEGFQDHFKGSWDSSRTTLQLLAATPDDAATYYCGARITLEQLCSRVNQKPADGDDRSLSISFWQLLPRALVRQWQVQEMSLWLGVTKRH
ncbi:hypothetical protein EK904_011301 [Melospiza melodia maxima]|nr:hypothetical protein EK904_011301 [Melospiza melodia maxima]